MSENINEEIFSGLEIDTIGEIMNISMGAAATAASTLLDNKVTITTPVVKVVPIDELQISQLLPAIAVEITYVEGISGSNILILRKEDVRTILSQMMMTEIPEDFVIDAMAESAICELMNQMMGSSATVLSCFLGRSINISTPNTVPIGQLEEFKEEHFGSSSSIITITFSLSITGIMDSTFVSVMQIDLAKEIIGVSLNFDNDVDMSQQAQDQTSASPPPAQMPASPSPIASTPPQPQEPYSPAAQNAYPHPAGPALQEPPYGAPPYGQQAAYGQGYPPPYPYPPYPGYGYPPPEQHRDPIKVQDYAFGNLPNEMQEREGVSNLDLVMNVPVVVTVELGRTKRKIREILEFGQGSIVELDKQAGSSVDVIVNGQLIAHGDVVVVDDNFSIRITEILKSRDSLTML